MRFPQLASLLRRLQMTIIFHIFVLCIKVSIRIIYLSPNKYRELAYTGEYANIFPYSFYGQEELCVIINTIFSVLTIFVFSIYFNTCLHF